ncbi:MAG: pilus assembly protein TadG-related protein [Pseudooceanicola sp.]
MKQGTSTEKARGGTLRTGLERHLTRFAQREDGVMIAIVIFFLLILMTVGGIGVDIMRQEMVRSRVQTTLDRAILAAADLEQELEPEAVVRDYFDKAGVGEYLTDVTVNQGTTYRIVSARASTEMKTQFLGSIGFDSFTINASGTAEESLGDAEISLVLDISGSMQWDNKMTNLIDAAKDFVDTVVLDESEGSVSINLIPYTAQVNAGPEILDRLNIPRRHGFSSCVLFEDADFDTTEINPATAYVHAEHFELYDSSSSSTITNPSCPMRSYEQITAYSQDRGELKEQIGQLTHRANTSIHIGMKWGVGLLDPAIRPVISGMVSAGVVDEAFDGRPVDYGSGSLKTVILMTDGENVSTYGIRDQAYGTPSQRYHWHKNALIDWVRDNVDRDEWDDYYFRRRTSTQADSDLKSVCDAAKNAGILVWSVGFEVSDHGASVMRDCASSASHFFRVEDTEISEAFKSIARQLNKLKLTQ